MTWQNTACFKEMMFCSKNVVNIWKCFSCQIDEGNAKLPIKDKSANPAHPAACFSLPAQPSLQIEKRCQMQEIVFMYIFKQF